jgi:hypothetical protein
VIRLKINILSISSFRKFLASALLLFFLFNIGGYFIWYNIARSNIQKEIKQEIRKGLAEKDLTQISVPVGDESAIAWIKPGKEFTYAGAMYDVVKSEIRKGRKIYYCIDDVKEKKLVAGFAKMNESNQKARKLLSNFQYIFVIQPGSYYHINETTDHEFCISPFEISLNDVEITLPPPKAVFEA